jgi:hypothetical protein
MTTRRTFSGAVAALLLGSAVPGLAQQRTEVTVYKSPTCGCCGEWVKHMRANGFSVTVHEVEDVTRYRQRSMVPDHLASCHTALVGGYAIEGHVPAGDIRRLLRERPHIIGLSVPGMIAGSPGMEQGPPQPYATIAFNELGERVYARH